MNTPIDLYHGSNHDFDEFSVKNKGRVSTVFGDESVERHGSFHTIDKNVAKQFGKNVYHSRVVLKNPFDSRNGISEKMEKDYVDHGGRTSFLYNHMPDWERFDGEAGEHHVSVLKKAGYDSVIINGEVPETGEKIHEYVLLHPHKPIGKIKMKTLETLREDLKKYSEAYEGFEVLTEAMHQELNDILDSELPPRHKLNQFTKKVRSLISAGHDTGLENDKPIKGSSRAVFFDKEPHKLKIDGVDTEIPAVTKIAFRGSLDPHTNRDQLLGEMQNLHESDNYSTSRYGMLRKAGSNNWNHDNKPNEYHSNDDGVLVPHLGSHEEGHWARFGRVEKPTAALIKEATKTPDFPKGLTHDQIYDTVNAHHKLANGMQRSLTEEQEKISNHPLVENLINFHLETGTHPADMMKRNMGIWTHPVTKTKHYVVSDYGFSDDVANAYNEGRRNYAKKNRRY